MLRDQLEKQLSNLNSKAQLSFDWFSIASSVALARPDTTATEASGSEPGVVGGV